MTKYPTKGSVLKIPITGLVDIGRDYTSEQSYKSLPSETKIQIAVLADLDPSLYRPGYNYVVEGITGTIQTIEIEEVEILRTSKILGYICQYVVILEVEF